MELRRVKRKLKELLRLIGIEVELYSSSFQKQLISLLETLNIDLILDIGANEGLYGEDLRKNGFKGRIVSFEPIHDVFKILEKKSRNDPSWDVYNYALGNKTGKESINISNNSVSSSLLDITPKHIESNKDSEQKLIEEISVFRLEDIFDQLSLKAEQNIFIKIDTQGYEKEVLIGAGNKLHDIKGIQIELSFVELYTGQALFNELHEMLQNQEFLLYNIERGFANKQTGQLLQCDGVYVKDV